MSKNTKETVKTGDTIVLHDIEPLDEHLGFNNGDKHTVISTANNEAFIYRPNQEDTPDDEKRWWAFTEKQFDIIDNDVNPHA